MKLMVTLLLLALMSQSYAAKKSTKHKKTEKNEKRGYEENNYGDRIESKGHSKYEDNDSEEDLSERPHVYSPHHYSKISDVLSEGPYHDAIASHLYSPVSPYQHRFHVPGYEISAPIASELAYSAHETHMPSYSKKYKKKGQSKHNYHEEDSPKELYYPHSSHHLAAYPQEYALRNIYPHIPHHVYAQRALVSPHLYHGASQLYHGVSPLIHPILPHVLSQQVIPQIGLPQTLAYANGGLAYPQGYVQPVQYVQQQAVEQAIPNAAYSQEAQAQNHESQETGAQATSSGVVGQQLQQNQQPHIQNQQVPAQVPQPVQYQNQLQPQLIQPHAAQTQQLHNVQPQPQQLQNVQAQSRPNQGAVSYASFSRSLPSNYEQQKSLNPPLNQPTHAASSQFTLSHNYQVNSQSEPKSQSLFQVGSTAQQQMIFNSQPVQTVHTTSLPQFQSAQNTQDKGYLPPMNNQKLDEEGSHLQDQIQTLEQISGIQETTPSAESIIHSQTYPQLVATSSPKLEQGHSQSNKESTETDVHMALQELSDRQPTADSEKLLIQVPGVPGADIQYFGSYARTLFKNFHQ